MTTHKRTFLNVTLWTWWTLVICVVVSSFATWAAVDHANANQQRALRHSNAQFQRAQILANRKFREAIQISTAQTAYSVNKGVCVLRPFLRAALKARLAAVRDAKNEADRKLNQQAATTYTRLLEGEVTVPSDFDCDLLPKNPPKPKGG